MEEELSKTKYNKRTQGHIGLVKAKIAQLKEKQVQRRKGKGKTEGYTVRKSGDSTVIMIGFPSVGKSTLLNKLTNAQSATASYAYTTLTVIPGMLNYRGAKIQILDVQGGWYLILKIQGFVSEEKLALELLEKDHVYIHPGYFFDFEEDAHIIISLLPEEKTFSEGLKRIADRIQSGTTLKVMK